MPCACWLCPRISIHALREEGDQAPQTRKEQAKYFYPRPPRGGRPADGYLFSDQYGFLSTPSARRATPYDPRQQAPEGISIHALREEGDTMKEVSTISKRISIHALREEGDDDVSLLRRGDRISIHALREEGDRDADDRRAAVVGFLSTPSARRATRQ